MVDFIIAGAARSGTTSLSMYLKEHPEIFIPQGEPRFFVSDFYRNLSQDQPNYKKIKNAIVFYAKDYQSLFRFQGKKIIGDKSVAYLCLYELAVPNIKKYAPRVKIIIILRKPWERAFSAYMYSVQRKFENMSFEDALRLEEKRRHNHWEPITFYIQSGFYYDCVKAFLNNFDQVKVYLYDDFVNDPLMVVKDAYAFLGVDVAFTPDVKTRYNASGVSRNQFLNSILIKPLLPGKLKLFADLFIPERRRAKIKSWLMEKNSYRPQLPLGMKQYLKDIYHEDIVKLQDLLKRDLSPWLNEK